MTFDLPMPPSSNMMFINSRNASGKGRFPSPAYKLWRKVASEALQAQYAAYGSPALHAPLQIRLRLNLDYRGDIANREKAVTDLLVATLDMPDDRWVERYIIERDRTISGAVVEIGVAE